MLGSFPPPRARWCMDFFYPNRTNMMWEIFGVVFFNDASRLIDTAHKSFLKDDIIRLLNDRGIAIYDTATAVRRLQPLCHDIVCTGQKSAETLCEDYGATVPRMGESSTFTIAERSMRLWRMPSSSRAFPMKIQEKARYYRAMMQQVGCLSSE